MFIRSFISRGRRGVSVLRSRVSAKIASIPKEYKTSPFAVWTTNAAKSTNTALRNTGVFLSTGLKHTAFGAAMVIEISAKVLPVYYTEVEPALTGCVGIVTFAGATVSYFPELNVFSVLPGIFWGFLSLFPARIFFWLVPVMILSSPLYVIGYFMSPKSDKKPKIEAGDAFGVSQ